MIGIGVSLALSAANRAARPAPVPIPKERLYRGIRYQSWPFSSTRPDHDYFSGSIEVNSGYPGKTEAQWLERIRKFTDKQEIFWELIK